MPWYLFSSQSCRQDPLAEASADSPASACTLYLTAVHSICQAPQLPIGHCHVILAHCTVLQAPALSIIIHQLSCFTREEQGFLVIL